MVTLVGIAAKKVSRHMSNPICHVAGPPTMVSAAHPAFNAAGFDEDDTRTKGLALRLADVRMELMISYAAILSNKGIPRWGRHV
jgi:hypothetical protein